MSSDAAKRKEVDASRQLSAGAVVGDHRKRRRNRTTQSCLNCHTSKRMCDRMRPCGRCTQLGITGLCVYEVDDPSQGTGAADDKTRLQKRVAELEGVIRELKNKPHPRWAHSLSDTYQDQAIRIITESASSPCAEGHTSKTSQGGKSGVVVPSPPPTVENSAIVPRRLLVSKEQGSRQASLASSPLEELPEPRWPIFKFVDLFSVAPSSLSVSPLTTPEIRNPPLSALSQTSPGDDAIASLLSYVTDGVLQSDTPFAGLFDSDNLPRDMTRNEATPDACLSQHSGQQTPPSECGCLSEVANYQVVLELSLRLRCAAEALNRHPQHKNSSMCLLKQRIAEMDVFTSNTLGNVDMPGMSRYLRTPPTQTGLTSTLGCASPDAGWTGGSASFSEPANVSPNALGWPSDDSLMCWTPQRHLNVSISSATRFFPRKF